MVRRHLKSDFVGGAYVFPGGVLDSGDDVDERLCLGHTDASASAQLNLPRGGLAYRVAAIRECFEEAGILLLCNGSGTLVDFSDADTASRFEEYRRALIAGGMSLSDIAQRERLMFATDRLMYWAHWITPAGQPRRYDTRFFVARAPQGQIAAHDGREVTDSCWITPEGALEKVQAGEWMMILPTLHNVRMLGDCRNSLEVERFARTEREIAAIQPRAVWKGSQLTFLLPGEPGYEDVDQSSEQDGGESRTDL